MKDAGVGLIGLGLLAIVIGFFVKVGRSIGYPVGEVANLHAMHVQALVFQAGFVAFLSGVVLYVGGSINESIRAKGSDQEVVPVAVEAVPPVESAPVEPVSNWVYAVVIGGLILMVVLGIIAATKSGSPGSSSANVAMNVYEDLNSPMPMDNGTMPEYPDMNSDMPMPPGNAM